MKEPVYPKVSLTCNTCGAKARRPLVRQAGCRGHHETPCEPALCPKGHGPMVRVDGRAVVKV